MSNIQRTFILMCKLVWVLWAVAVIVGSLLPGPMLPAAPVSDKIEHFTAYFGLCVLPPLFLYSRRLIMWSPVAMVALSICLEIAQTQIPGRTFDLFDIRANMIGAAVGFIAGRLLEKFLAQSKAFPRLRHLA
jgi:VanZ family protein